MLWPLPKANCTIFLRFWMNADERKLKALGRICGNWALYMSIARCIAGDLEFFSLIHALRTRTWTAVGAWLTPARREPRQTYEFTPVVVQARPLCTAYLALPSFGEHFRAFKGVKLGLVHRVSHGDENRAPGSSFGRLSFAAATRPYQSCKRNGESSGAEA